MSCKASVSNLSAFVVLHNVGGPHVGHGFLVKAQRSAILWQVKYGCHSDDNSNITRVVKMSTRGVSVPFTRRYLFFWLHIQGKRNNRRTLPFHKHCMGRKNFNFLPTLYVLIAARLTLGISRRIDTLEMDIRRGKHANQLEYFSRKQRSILLYVKRFIL